MNRAELVAEIVKFYKTHTDRQIGIMFGYPAQTIRYLRRSENLKKERSDFNELQKQAIQEYKNNRKIYP